MGRKKKTQNNYFHSGIEEAIQLYNTSQSELERNRLFKIIYPAIAKIAEVYYNKIKPEYIEGEPLEIQMDCICYLSERLYRIQPGKGKAYSYLTVCAKNYYIFYNQKGYKSVQKTLHLDQLNDNWDIADDFDRPAQMEFHAGLISAFGDYIVEYKDKLVANKFQKEFIVELAGIMKKGEWVEGYTDRNFINHLASLYPKIATTASVRKILNRLCYHYTYFKKEYEKGYSPIPYLSKNKLTKEEADYCIKYYQPNDRTFGVIALSKKFNVEFDVIKKELHKIGVPTL
jgi:hypothetical protein